VGGLSTGALLVHIYKVAVQSFRNNGTQHHSAGLL
jgi:hypothetical protein